MSEICAKYEVWIANYWDYGYETLSPSYSTKYGMYQYTDRNYIGSNGPYDGDVAFKDYPSIVRQYGFNGYGNPEAYLDQCTVYPSHCKLITTKSTPLNTLPCSASSSNGSRTLLTAEAGQTYIAKALYLNASSNYWYQITLDTGDTAYLYGGHATMEESIGTDITVSAGKVPDTLNKADSFAVSGKVMSARNILDEVEVGIYTGSGLLGTPVATETLPAENNTCDLAGASLDFATLEAGSYFYNVTAGYSGYYATSAKEATTYSGRVSVLHSEFSVIGCEHSFTTKVIRNATCTTDGLLERTCTNCGLTSQSTIVSPGHQYTATAVGATCTQAGGTRYTCLNWADTFLDETVPTSGHSYVNGTCTLCGHEDPDNTLTKPILTLKSPTLEFKDMICINAFFTAENTQNVVEMGMITYDEKVTTAHVTTADHVIPGAIYMESTGRYCASSQGIHAKYLGDTVYLAVYARLTDGSYAYSKVAPYSPVQYATSQLKNSTDVKLKKLVAAMLNYGAEAQLYFGHNTDSLANASLTADQKALPEVYRADMVGSVPATPADKQSIFANNSGFSKRTPAISFEGAFCINYFFTPKYAPANGITLYYWKEADYNAASVLTASNATGKIKLEGSGTGQYRGDITGISAKNLSEAVYVVAAYKDSSGNVWTSGVLGYSIGAYCSSQASKGGTIATLSQATVVYGFHAKQYFG